MRLTVTAMVSCLGKLLVRVVGRVRRMCLLLLGRRVLLRMWVFAMGSEVSGTAFANDQGMTYNMAAHVGVELSAVL